MTKSTGKYYTILLLVLFGQFVLVKLYTEPYPAIILPGFGIASQEKNQVELIKYGVCYAQANDCVQILDTQELLQNYPQHLHQRLLKNLFSLSSNLDSGNRISIKRILNPNLNSGVQGTIPAFYKEKINVDKNNGQVLSRLIIDLVPLEYINK